jgi:hypothetical protein
MEAVSSSETSVNFYQATWCDMLEDSNIKNKLSLIHVTSGGLKCVYLNRELQKGCHGWGMQQAWER